MHPFSSPFSRIVFPIIAFFVLTLGLSATARADAIAGDEAADSSRASSLSVARGTATVANSGEATFSIPDVTVLVRLSIQNEMAVFLLPAQ